MLKIAVLPGDGTGPEVVNEGLKVLAAIAKEHKFEYTTQDFDFGGDRYLKTGEILPEGAPDELRKFDAIYLAFKLIAEGRVRVNGKPIASPALNVTARDKVEVDGKAISAPEPARLWLYRELNQK